MSDDDGILLNVTQHKTEDNVKKLKKNIKLNRFENISEKEQRTKNTVKLVSKSHQRRYIDPKDFIPISSLFNKNPEIPFVPDKNDGIERVQETLFSNDKVEHLDIGKKLKNNILNHMNFTVLTTVQKLSIPLLLEGKDVMIKSPTGSGKTVCYSIPIVDKLSKCIPTITRADGPYVLVIVPTRELALQTLSVFQDLCKCCISIVPGMLIGGEKSKSEKARLRKGVNILIATPGRLIYHLNETSSLDISHLQYFILDEADHLLDMGFRDKVQQIVEIIDKRSSVKRQSILMSATLNNNVQDLISISLKDPVFVYSEGTCNKPATQNDLDYVTPESLSQYFITVPAKLRLITLIIFTHSKVLLEKSKVIVFVSSKSTVTFLSDAFKISASEMCNGFQLNQFSLHGDMTQQERFKAFEKFKCLESGVLFCTDIASRGLDIKKVDWVVQYVCPTKTEDYLHRIGRTARIGEKGNSVLFLLPSEVGYIEILHKSSVTLSEIKLTDMLKRFDESKSSKCIEDELHSIQNKVEEAIIESKELHQKATLAYKSFIQGYATYPKDMKHIFHIKLLHLGHIAKSFGLRSTPSVAIAASIKGTKRKGEKTKKEHQKKTKVDELGEVLSGPRTKRFGISPKQKKRRIRI